MKATIIYTLFLLGLCLDSFGQNCNCEQELLYVKHKLELNYAGYKDKVNAETKARYEKETDAALARSKAITKPAYCIYLIKDWMSFFRDGHLQIGRNQMTKETEIAALQKRMQETESIKLSASQLSALNKQNDIEGIYWNSDSTIQIALMKASNNFRTFAGVILTSKVNSWKPGQVILELKSPSTWDTLKGIEYDNNHIPASVTVAFNKNSLGEWQKAGTKSSLAETVLQTDVASKLLSEKTFYIKIGTFNQRNAHNIDSLFIVNKTTLEKTPNLILDLRDNGGGSDFAYRPITPYIYTDTIKTVGADILASEDNMAGWASLLQMNDIPDDQKVFIADVVKQMKQHIGSFISLSEGGNTTFENIEPYPKKVAILVNRHCGSTTEEFLLAAQQSSKVTLMGEPTAGVLDYANMRSVDFSCMPYTLYLATSRSKRIEQGKAIDNVGIKPDKTLSQQQNWIQEAQHYLENEVQ